MKNIESRHNPQYRQWVRQRKNAGRVGHSVWLEGPHLCESWIENTLPVDWLIIDSAKQHCPEIQGLQARIPLDKQVILAAGLFSGLSDVQSHQGVLMIAPAPERELPETLTQNSVILDGIQDPGNVGVILRVCAAVGIRTVMTQGATAACWSPKVLRSAQGAHAGLQIYEQADLVAWLTSYCTRPDRLPILVTTLETATPLYQTQLPAKGIWVFGSEGQGVSPAIVALADRRVRIEHQTQFVESLNVGVAAALCLFEQQRQNVHELAQ